MGIEEDHIVFLYNDRKKSDGNARNLANLINSNIHNNLSGDKYLNEILQNADDVESPSIEFILEGEYLIVKHQGKHFTESDVDGIVNCADPNRAKVHDRDKIGNKGIGFKSVFSLASQVYILSKKYTFKFDEAHDEWSKKPGEHPWQTIPIWVDKTALPSTIQAHLDDASVCYVLKIRDKNLPKIQEQFKKISPHVMLFLRHIKEIKKNGESIAKLPRKEKLKEKISKIVLSAEKTIFLWEDYISIPEKQKKLFAADTSIAPKYQKGDPIPLTLAILVENKALTPIKNEPHVYCYLPTNIDIGLSFIAHAEFLLDDSRMNLRDDGIGREWNGLILENLFFSSVMFLSYFNTTPLWDGVFNILSFPEHVPDIFKPRCTEVFDNTIGKTPLVTTLKNNKILIKNAVQDRVLFATYFGDNKLKENCIDTSTKNNPVLKKLCQNVLKTEDIKTFLVSRFKTSEIGEIKKNISFLRTIKTICKNDDEFKLFIKRHIASYAWILSSDNQLKPSGQVYIPNQQLEKITQQLTFIHFIHPEIVEQLGREWSIEMGVQELALEQLIAKANNTPQHLPHFTGVLATDHDLQKTYQGNTAVPKQEKEKCIKLIGTIKVCDHTGSAKYAADFYLPAPFKPKEKIEVFVGEDSPYLLKGYGEHADSIPAIKNFLIIMGVYQEIKLENIHKLTKAVNDSGNPAQLLKYTQYLFIHFYYNQPEEQQNRLVNDIKFIDVVNQDGEVIAIADSYLADHYHPAQQIGDALPPSIRLSTNYCEQASHLNSWRTFFIGIGVKETLGIQHHKSITPQGLKELDNDYYGEIRNIFRQFDFLGKTSITNYIHIHFVTHILGAKLFWDVIQKNWVKIELILNDGCTVYGKSCTSSIHYWLNKHIQKTHPEKKSSDFYYNGLVALLGSYTQYTSVLKDESLTLEQARMLQFKTKLTPEDCIALLIEIAKSDKSADDIEKIKFIYNQILLSNSITASETLALANQQGGFTPTFRLSYIEGNLFSHVLNPHLMKKTANFPEKNFLDLCKALGVKTIPFSELIVTVTDKHKSDILVSIKKRLPYILLAEAKHCDLHIEHNQTEFNSLQSEIKRQLEAIKFICSDTITISHADILNEAVDIWVDFKNSTVYHQEELDHGDQETLYEFIYQHLKLKISYSDFTSIMTSSVDKLNRKYNIQPLKAEAYEEVSSSSNNNNTGKKRNVKVEEEDEDEDETCQLGYKRHQQTTEKSILYLPSKVCSKMESCIEKKYDDIFFKDQGANSSIKRNQENIDADKRLQKESVMYLYEALRQKHIKKHEILGHQIVENGLSYKIESQDKKYIKEVVLDNSETSKTYNFSAKISKDGKSETRQYLAYAIWGNGKKLRIDCQYKEKLLTESKNFKIYEVKDADKTPVPEIKKIKFLT